MIYWNVFTGSPGAVVTGHHLITKVEGLPLTPTPTLVGVEVGRTAHFLSVDTVLYIDSTVQYL